MGKNSLIFTFYFILLSPSLIKAQNLIQFRHSSPGQANFISKQSNSTFFDLQKTISSIAAYQTVDAGAVGFSGHQSEQYERFITLMVHATDSQLIKLCDHYNANVKAYAYWALVKKKSKAYKYILEQHLNDKQTFSFFSGCSSELTQLKKFFL